MTWTHDMDTWLCKAQCVGSHVPIVMLHATFEVTPLALNHKSWYLLTFIRAHP
jgi:hypothetical protein